MFLEAQPHHIMLAAALLAPTAFTPPGRGVQQSCDRREMISKVAGGAFALGGLAQGASAKAGQFGKQEIFGFGSASPPAGFPPSLAQHVIRRHRWVVHCTLWWVPEMVRGHDACVACGGEATEPWATEWACGRMRGGRHAVASLRPGWARGRAI